MTAIKALQSELIKVQKAQARLVDENGIVRPYVRYQYQQYVIKAAEIKKGIQLLEEIKENKQKAVR